MTNVDPGDPFVRGTLRFEAREKLLEALETFLDEVINGEDNKRPWEYPGYRELVKSRRVWVSYGRDGE